MLLTIINKISLIFPQKQRKKKENILQQLGIDSGQNRAQSVSPKPSSDDGLYGKEDAPAYQI
jgi:hypothetical protein